MKHGNVTEAREEWARLPWAGYHTCTGCSEQRYCHGRRKTKMQCFTCYCRENMARVAVKILIKAGFIQP